MSDSTSTSIKTFSHFFDQERAEHLDRQARISAIGEVATFVFTFLTGTLFFPIQKLALWLAPSVGVSVFVYFYVQGVSGQSTGSSAIRLKRSMIGAFSVGLAWGLFPFFFFIADDVFYIIIIVGIFTGLVSGCLSSTFAHSPSFYAFTTGIYTPFVCRLILTDSLMYQILAGLISFYILTLCIHSKNLSDLFRKTAQANYEKSALVDELVREKEIALKATESKTRFLSSASHDLRQPINAIGLFASSLKLSKSEERSAIIVGKIEQSVNALNGILHRFSEISRLEAGLVSNSPVNLCLKSNLTRVIDDLKDDMTKPRIQMLVPPETSIYADAEIFRNVATNLIDNAIKYTPDGNILITAKQHSNYVNLIIEDTGLGISPTKVNSIFDEFEQLNNPERDRRKGIGLGLSMVRRLCLLGGISLKLTSEPDAGTRVELRFEKGAFSEAVERTQQVSTIDFSEVVILVIEDEQDTLEGMGMLIEDWGSQCILCDSSKNALLELEKSGLIPDIILTDYRLRGEETGVDAIEDVQEEYNSKIPAIILTGDTSPQRFLMLSKGSQTYMFKPIDPSELKRKVAELINSKLPRHA